MWWDADPLREILSKGVISKWQGATLGAIQGGVQHVADIAGDWREEIVAVLDGELRIYSTSIPAADRRVSLMQDPLYRNDVTHRSMGYPHVPMTSYYLGVRAVAPSRSRGQQRSRSRLARKGRHPHPRGAAVLGAARLGGHGAGSDALWSRAVQTRS